MDVMAIEGGLPLRGEAEIHGAKNAVLPVLAAALLCPRSILRRCPMLTDVWSACRILEHLGCRVTVLREDRTLTVEAWEAREYGIPDTLAGEMRGSIIFLGALLARFGRAHIALPGGCRLGPRPIDLHIGGLRRMGVRIIEQEDGLLCTAEDGLRGADIRLSYPSVGATENLLIAAALARGETILRGAAGEPEIDGLIDFLNRAGARISREDGLIRIEGVQRLREVDYTIIPDRIEAATYLSAAAATGGEITLKGVELSHLEAVLPVFEEMGCRLNRGAGQLTLTAPKRLSPIAVTTAPYPDFPTDALAPVMAASLLAEGESRFEEGVFDSRYLHVEQLQEMGGQIRLDGQKARVTGVDALRAGKQLHCTDLRGGAALVIAALAAQGVSMIGDLRHICRGYDDLPAVLRRLGGRVWMISGVEEPHLPRTAAFNAFGHPFHPECLPQNVL
ncbi:MAG: UDP-N-acetylglucosamine 1-carboxyvinyltransferase [Oscillospiraceae bacterium]|nr:UDP-N-acetylglucosamine 1-carboxyvinyltransferase [Oscillospiraceae bacterium]